MASPFAVFRKNQKVMLALLTILVVLGFVFLPAVLELMGSRSRGTGDEIVVTSKYGNLREFELANRMAARYRLLGVMSELLQRAGADPQTARQYCELTFGPATEESVVDSWLLAHRAKELGMAIDRETVNAFVMVQTQNAVDAETILQVLRNANISERDFFGMVQDALLAVQFKELYLPNPNLLLQTTTPAQRWNYYARTKRQAVIEAIPVPVVDFAKQVEEPSDKELENFFEKGKDKLPHPESPDPAFRRPQQVTIEYFKADLEKFADPKVISDAEVQQYYEKHREALDQYFQSATEFKAALPESPASGEPAQKNEPVQKKEGVKSPVKESPAKEKTPKDATKDVKTPVDAKPADGKKTSAAGGTSPFVLTALQTEKTEKKSAEPQAEKKADAKPGAGKTPALGKELSPPKTVLTDAMKSVIRQSMALEKVEKIFEELRSQMNQYREAWEPYHLEMVRNQGAKVAEKQAVEPPPPPPDFEKLAKASGISAGRIGPMAQWEVQETDIGTSFAGGLPVYLSTFHLPTLFRAERSRDIQNNHYLFWKTKEIKEHVPKLSAKGVHNEVLQTWKLVHARKAAIEAAERLAAEARKKNGESLRAVFAYRPELHVVLPTPFTWMTFGNVALRAPRDARISRVAGVELAGQDFMKTVFHLKPGEIGVAFNAPQTVAYVVRVSEFTPSYKVLWELFTHTDFQSYAVVGREDVVNLRQAWFAEIRGSADLKWLREAKRDQESRDRRQQEEE